MLQSMHLSPYDCMGGWVFDFLYCQALLSVTFRNHERVMWHFYSSLFLTFKCILIFKNFFIDFIWAIRFFSERKIYSSLKIKIQIQRLVSDGSISLEHNLKVCKSNQNNCEISVGIARTIACKFLLDVCS